MQRPSIQNKLREIANKYGISLAAANEIIKSQWDTVLFTFQSAIPEEGYYPQIRVIGLGKFFVTKQRQYKVRLKLEADGLYRPQVLQSPDRVHGDASSNTPSATEEKD